MERITILDIAREAGVSKSTVSRVLTGHPRVSQVTKEKVKQIAGKLNYRPDPALGVLCSYRNARRKAGILREFPIAIVTDFSEPMRGPYLKTVVQRIRAHAAHLGYSISTIKATDYPHPSSVARVLKSRGIRGIICLAINHRVFAEEFPWEEFSVVLHGQPKFRPACNLVREDRFDRTALAVRRAWELGYRRPAFAMVADQEQISRYFDLSAGAYYSEVARLTGSPNLIEPRRITPREDDAEVRAWVEQNQPDAIIGENQGVLNRLEQAGYSIPRDMGFAAILRLPERRDVAGFNLDCPQQARTLVEQLDLLIRQNILGFPPLANSTLIKMAFEDGDTLPPRVPAANAPSR